MENSNQLYYNGRESTFYEDNKRLAAGLLAIIAAPFGVHKFLLGFVKEGFFWLVLSVITMGMLKAFLGIVEGIIYLSKSDREFYSLYQIHHRKWF